MEEMNMLPPIKPDKFNSNDLRGRSMAEDGRNFRQVTVNVFDSGNSEVLKLQTKLNHDDSGISWPDEMKITKTRDEGMLPRLPVLFETNNVTVPKRKLKDLVLTGRFALADFDMLNKSSRLGSRKQGHIILYPDSINYLESLSPNQKEYSGRLESGDSNFINDSVGTKIVENKKGTASSTTAVQDARYSVGAEKGTSDKHKESVLHYQLYQELQTAAPDKSDHVRNADPELSDNVKNDISDNARKAAEQGTLDKWQQTLVSETSDNAKNADKNKTLAKHNNSECLDERTLVDKETQTEKYDESEPVDGKGAGILQCDKQSDENDNMMKKPSIKLCNLKLEEIKDVKNAVRFDNKLIESSEGKKIWEEVDALIKRSLPKCKLRKGKQKTVPSSPTDSIKPSIEFSHRFRRTGKEYFHFVDKDDMWTLLLDPDSISDSVEMPLYYGESTFDRVYGIPCYEDRLLDYGDFLALQNMQRNGDRSRFLEESFLLEHGYGELLNLMNRDPANIQKSSSAPPANHLPPGGACSSSTMMMTTTLPRLTPASTPLPTGITQQPPRSHSSASLYVPYPPKDLSNSMDYMKMPTRVNPLQPPPPRKRINWSWETVDQHHENEKRRLLMQKREHTRYHSAWSKAFYGAPAEKEAYRRHYREVLKQQMDDSDNMKKTEFQIKSKESERALAYDKQCQKNDSNEFYRKHGYLQQFRDGNKQQMEDRWADVRFKKRVEDRVDRERLRYNPINWSCTLK